MVHLEREKERESEREILHPFQPPRASSLPIFSSSVPFGTQNLDVVMLMKCTV
jgi:hypothetical protein